MSPPFALYTYEVVAGESVCHIYTTSADGSPLTQAEAQAAGDKLQAATPGLGFMVLPEEALPA